MDFVKKRFEDLPSRATPVMAADLNHMGDGIEYSVQGVDRLTDSVALKANAADVYSRAEVDAAVSPKADKSAVYTKAETYSRTETGTQITNAITASRPPLYGTGFPNGQIAAPVGTLYADTAVTNGASLWQKTEGTGVTGWVVVAGDTGERSIPALFNEPFQVSTGPEFHALLSREGVFVQLDFRVEVTAAVSIQRKTILTLPRGFEMSRYGANGVGSVLRGGREVPVILTTLSHQGAIEISGEGLSAGDVLSAQIVGRSRSAWPSTLPGTAW